MTFHVLGPSWKAKGSLLVCQGTWEGLGIATVRGSVILARAIAVSNGRL
jgi:hypothetical protein